MRRPGRGHRTTRTAGASSCAVAFLGDAAQSRSVFFTVRERGFEGDEFVKGLRFWLPTTLVEDVIVDGRSWDE